MEELYALIEQCGLGKVDGDILPVSGGLMHRMFKVQTTTGTYAVKCLNPEIMNRPDAMKNYSEAEWLEWILEENGISIVAALSFGDKKMISLGGRYYYVFHWNEGKITDFNDISEKMLDKDRELAESENLSIEIVKGNMCDLSQFSNDIFDMVINPPSLMYVPNLDVVFDEVYRVTKTGGEFIIMAPNPINYLCDWIDTEDGGYYKAVHKMPWCSKDYDDSDWIEYGHTMEEYLGGLLKSGFVINGYKECQREDITELMFMVKAKK